MRYFFHIGYKGSKYRGWQRQPNVISIQEVLEDCLGKLLKTKIVCIGCGRTDAQVNASQYFFHIDVFEALEDNFLFKLNKTLPSDIAIFEIIFVNDSYHAQFDAIERTYDYFIHTYKDPFLHDISSLYQGLDLNLEAMKAATALLPLYDNYRAFCLTPEKHDSTLSKVKSAQLYVDANGDKLRFQITANRFLKAMIRIIVGRLIEVGTGEMSVATFENYLITKEGSKTVKPAYPQGLFLSKVTYPFLDLPVRTDFSAILQNRAEGFWQEV